MAAFARFYVLAAGSPLSDVRITIFHQRSPIDSLRPPRNLRISYEEVHHRAEHPRRGQDVGRAAPGAASNAALVQLAPRVQWVESYVAKDKTFCVYLAEDEAVIHEHAKMSGFPANKITEVGRKIDPMTAEG